MMVLSNFADVGRDNAFDLTDAWVAILESAAKSESISYLMQGIATAKIGSACIANDFNELHTENPRTVRSNRSCGDGIRQVAQVASGAPEKNNNCHDG